MPYSYSQNFDSLTTGNLNGQDSWSGSSLFQVQTGTVIQGTKTPYVSVTSGYNAQIGRSITAVDKGEMSFYVRVTNNNSNTRQIKLTSSGDGTGNARCGISFKSGNIYGIDNNSDSFLQAYSNNTNYLIKFVFDSTAGKYDIYVDGTKKANQITMASSGNVNYIHVGCFGEYEAMYFDDIQLTETVSTDTTKFFNFF